MHHYLVYLLVFLRWSKSPPQLHCVGKHNYFLIVIGQSIEGVVAYLLFQHY